MASYSTWIGKKAKNEAAFEFLKTGVTRAVLGGTACYNSEECASGYACINNKCTSLSPQKASEQCGTGTTRCGSECGKSGPGLACLAQDCCGDRCCRFDVGGVNCFCGECPEPNKECNQFCTTFYQNNITQPLPSGCEGNYCDECAACVTQDDGGTKCEISNTGPCWCDKSRERYCQLCSEDGSWYDDKRCWPCRPFTDCGVPTGQTICASLSASAIANLKTVRDPETGEEIPIDKPCELCQEPGNLCETISEEVNGPYNPSYTPPSAPAGYTNTSAGYFYDPVTNKTKYFTDRCQIWTPPDACFEKCRCNSDCGPCLKCDPTTLLCVGNSLEPGCP